MVFNNIILDYRDPSVPPECPHLCQKTFYKRPHRYQAPALIRPARSLASEAGTCPQPAPLVRCAAVTLEQHPMFTKYLDISGLEWVQHGGSCEQRAWQHLDGGQPAWGPGHILYEWPQRPTTAATAANTTPVTTSS